MVTLGCGVVSIVNRVKVLPILFSSYLARFSSDLIRSSCVRSIIM
jgi:hypothetical protein